MGLAFRVIKRIDRGVPRKKGKKKEDEVGRIADRPTTPHEKTGRSPPAGGRERVGTTGGRGGGGGNMLGNKPNRKWCATL